ncbi:DUF3141 domain-containing protein, partial [Acinetobacter baumannii]
SGIAARAEAARSERVPAGNEHVFVQLDRLSADCSEPGWTLFRDVRDASIELTVHALYGTPWMKQLGEARQRRSQPRDIAKSPHVQELI